MALEESKCQISCKTSKIRICPGCHGNDNILFSDGFGDGDKWFHCFICGTGDCVDDEDIKDYLSGKNPPKLSPPYQDDKPIPRIDKEGSVSQGWPGAMTPAQMREWIAKQKNK